MAGHVLFQQSYRGYVWQLEVTEFSGSAYGSWRKWYDDGETLRPTQDGATIPLWRLPELHRAIGAYLEQSAI